LPLLRFLPTHVPFPTHTTHPTHIPPHYTHRGLRIAVYPHHGSLGSTFALLFTPAHAHALPSRYPHTPCPLYGSAPFLRTVRRPALRGYPARAQHTLPLTDHGWLLLRSYSPLTHAPRGSDTVKDSIYWIALYLCLLVLHSYTLQFPLPTYRSWFLTWFPVPNTRLLRFYVGCAVWLRLFAAFGYHALRATHRLFTALPSCCRGPLNMPDLDYGSYLAVTLPIYLLVLVHPLPICLWFLVYTFIAHCPVG